jgi:polar amino acid transport system substrate-binding protein
MKKYVVALILISCFTQSTFAQNSPLRVAITSFSPPFIMRSGLDKYYGFDIATIEYICRALDRPCEYLPMNSDNLIPALQEEQADIAIGGIVITLPNARLVRFSTPYMISKAQFITTDKAPFTSPFKIKQLSGKRIGVIKGSAFEEAVAKMRINKPRIITFERGSDIIEALHANTLDIALFSLLKANYWQTHSNSILKSIGRPFPIGLGFSIAIAPGKTSLTHAINAAVIQYQESTDYKRNYNLYFPEIF